MPDIYISGNWDSLVNDAFKPLFGDTSRYLVLKGGAGSGKSYWAVQKMLLRTISEEGHRFVVVRKVNKTIRNSVYKDLLTAIRLWKLEKLFHVKETDMSFVFKPNGNEIISVGLDDREKIKSLSQPTSFFIEEVTELSERDLSQLDYRLRGQTKNYKQIMMAFNPVSEMHWIKNRFFTEYVEQKLKISRMANIPFHYDVDGESVEVNAKMHRSTYKDNQFLDKEYKATLESYKEIDPSYYNIYVLGNWGTVGNLIYPNGFKMLSEESYPAEYDEIIYGLDFGYNNPTCLVEVGIRDKKYYLKELIYEKKLTNRDLIQRMIDLQVSGKNTIYADSAEPARIEEINRSKDFEGRSFYCMSADKSVKDGIDFIKNCEIYSNQTNISINREVQIYKWKEDAEGNPIDGEPLKINDHAMDAIRYPIYTYSRTPEFKMGFID